jgi:hypothetical protein
MVVLNIGRVLIAPRRLQAPAAGAGADHRGYLPATVAEPVGLRLGLCSDSSCTAWWCA